MRQYHRFKRQHPDAVLLFRMGDFYETFYDDAKVCARVCGLALTSRSHGQAAVPLAGFPYHALETYLKRLVAAGLRVAVCEQVQDPREAKGIVERDVVRVVTPGTLTEESILEAKANNFLPARALVGLGKTQEGLARLTSIAESETYEDVKSLAYYYIGTHIMGLPRPNLDTALVALRKSVEIYPTERACLAAAQCAIRLRKWDEARDYLRRAIRQFPAGDKRVIEEAKSLLPSVLKELARANPDRKGEKR